MFCYFCWTILQITYFGVYKLFFQLSVIVSWRAAVSVLDLSAQSLYQVFAGHAALSGVLLIVWVTLYRDTPLKHRLVNGLELNRIMTGRTNSQVPLLFCHFLIRSLGMGKYSFKCFRITAFRRAFPRF